MSSGRFRILYDLAAGGMGVVSVAEQLGERGVRRVVAVKRIRPDLASDPRFVDLLAEEARITSCVRHPGVVEVLELAEQDDELLLVMALVDGCSLRGLSNAIEDAGRVMPVGVAVRLIAKTARALHAAHEAVDERGAALGLVHRDVSPQNILLSFDGDVKVTDFGIAKVVSGNDATHSSTLRGKPAYLSPEQARGGAVDRRTDVWSLGVVAFEILTGQRLFKGRTDLETLRRLLEDPILRADETRKEVPSAVADVVERCLLRDPAARYADAEDLALAIEEALPVEQRASRADVAALIAEVLPGEREAFEEDLRLALESEGVAGEAGTPAQGPGGWQLLAYAAAGFVLVFSLRVGAEGLRADEAPELESSTHSDALAPAEEDTPPLPSPPAEVEEPADGAPEAITPTELEVEASEVETPPVVGAPVEPESASSHRRGRRRRGNESEAASAPPQTEPPAADPPRADPPRPPPTDPSQHRIVEDFPL